MTMTRSTATAGAAGLDSATRARVVRRETHSPRSGLAIVLAVVAIAALVWVGAESVLAALGAPRLALSPTDMAAGVRALPTVTSGVLIASGAFAAVVGLVLVVVAVTPGRRGRHVIPGPNGAAVVVDDEVIASSLADAATRRAGLDADAAVVTIGTRSAAVRLTPQSGLPVDRDAVLDAVRARIDAIDARPRLRPRISISTSGRVGA